MRNVQSRPPMAAKERRKKPGGFLNFSPVQWSEAVIDPDFDETDDDLDIPYTQRDEEA